MKNENDVEKCVSCGKHTIYVKDDPIYMRLCYVEGAGQLCSKCHDEIYHVEEWNRENISDKIKEWSR